jgi:threonine dehydratase
MSLEIGAGTWTLVIAVGGGSQAVGAMTVMRALRPNVRVYAVRRPVRRRRTMAGARTPRTTSEPAVVRRRARDARTPELTFPALCEVSPISSRSPCADRRGAPAALRSTHSLVEGAGATGSQASWRSRSAWPVSVWAS